MKQIALYPKTRKLFQVSWQFIFSSSGAKNTSRLEVNEVYEFELRDST